MDSETAYNGGYPGRKGIRERRKRNKEREGRESLIGITLGL